MRLFRISQIVVALAFLVAGGEIVQAAGPGGITSSFRSKSWFTKTITTTVLTANLESYDTETEPNATGVAQYKTTTVDVTFCGQTWSATCTTLTVQVSGLSDADGTQLALELNVDTSTDFGSAYVRSGSASFCFSSKHGGTVPTIEEGDHLDVILYGSSPDTVFLVHNDFGAPVVTVTTCGR